MACEKLNVDWKSGDSFDLTTNNLKIPGNYFTCGVYYYDGFFKIVEFPKGMYMYHGSGVLAQKNAEYPAGEKYYESVPEGDRSDLDDLDRLVRTAPGKSIDSLASSLAPISAGWFASYETAKTYSKRYPDAKKFPDIKVKCNEDCVMVYKTREKLKFILLDDPFNIWKFLGLTNKPQYDAINKSIRTMFDLESSVKPVPDRYEHGDITFQRKRVSYHSIDNNFAKWLCGVINIYDYQGYAANQQVGEGGKRQFHLEFMMCNSISGLERDLTNERDWQYSIALAPKVDLMQPVLQQLLKQMSYYKTYNINENAGNLLEHTIWTVLYTESIMKQNTMLRPKSAQQRQLVAAALLVDIGLMNPSAALVRRHDVVYLDPPGDYYRTSIEYIRNLRALPLLDDDMRQTGTLDMNELLMELGIVPSNAVAMNTIITAIQYHSVFLSVFNRIGVDLTPRDATLAFINETNPNRPLAFYYTIATVALASVYARQPYGIDNLTRTPQSSSLLGNIVHELNTRSTTFPIISNMPRKYRGSTFSTLRSIDLKDFYDNILLTASLTKPA